MQSEVNALPYGASPVKRSFGELGGRGSVDYYATTVVSECKSCGEMEGKAGDDLCCVPA